MYRDELDGMQARRVTSKGRLLRAATGAALGARAAQPRGSIVQQGADFLNGSGGAIAQAEQGRSRMMGGTGGISAGGLSTPGGRIGGLGGGLGMGPSRTAIGAGLGALAGTLSSGGGSQTRTQSPPISGTGRNHLLPSFNRSMPEAQAGSGGRAPPANAGYAGDDSGGVYYAPHSSYGAPPVRDRSLSYGGRMATQDTNTGEVGNYWNPYGGAGVMSASPPTVSGPLAGGGGPRGNLVSSESHPGEFRTAEERMAAALRQAQGASFGGAPQNYSPPGQSQGTMTAAGPHQRGGPVRADNTTQPMGPNGETQSHGLSAGGVVGGIGGFLFGGGPAGAVAGAALGDQVFGGEDTPDPGTLKHQPSYQYGGDTGEEQAGYREYLDAEIQAGRGPQALKYDAWRQQTQLPSEIYDSTLAKLNAATGEAPQFDNAALEATLKAGRAQRAQDQARNLAAMMQRGANVGATPGQMVANSTQLNQQDALTGYEVDTKARLSAELENFGARKEWARMERENAYAAMQASTSASERAAAEQHAMKMAALEKQYQDEYDQKMHDWDNEMSLKDWAGAGLGILGSGIGGVAGGVASGSIG